MNCPECGAPGQVTAQDYVINGFGMRENTGPLLEWCATKGCKHHHQTGRPYHIKKGVNQ